MMTPSQRHVLELLSIAPLDEAEVAAQRLRRDVLARLQRDGLIKFVPFGNPPGWKLLAAGRRALAEGNVQKSKSRRAA